MSEQAQEFGANSGWGHVRALHSVTPFSQHSCRINKDKVLQSKYSIDQVR